MQTRGVRQHSQEGRRLRRARREEETLQPRGVRQRSRRGGRLHHARREDSTLQKRGVRQTNAEGRTLSRTQPVFDRRPERSGTATPSRRRANVASAIAGGGGEKIESDTRNLQADVSCAAAPGSPSLRHSIMAPNFSDDDEDTIGAWIWRSSRMAKLGSANKTDVVLCVVMAQ